MPFFENRKLLLIHIPKTGGTSIEKYLSIKYETPLGPNALYFSYYPNKIQSDIDRYRKLWKTKLLELRKKQESKKIVKSRFLHLINKEMEDNGIINKNVTRDQLPEFKLFKKVRLSKELKHSLQHLTWSEMQIHRDILWENSDFHNIVSSNPYDRNEYEIITVVRNPYDRVVSELLFQGILNAETIHRPSTVYLKLKKFLEKYDDTFDNHKLPQYMFLLNEHGCMIENITILHTETLTQDMHRIGYVDFDHHFQVSKCRISNGKTKYSNILNGDAINLINTYYKRDFELFNYDFLDSEID